MGTSTWLVVSVLLGVAVIIAAPADDVHDDDVHADDVPADREALFLSDLVEQGKIDEAVNLSRVTAFAGLLEESYSGLFTVNEEFQSNMFFWFIPAQNQSSEAPLLLWLNGGPSVPSTVGAFLENGPLAFTLQGVERRNVSWTQSFNMLYIDSPVGTGYSYTNNTKGYATSLDDVSTNVYSVLVQFFKMFPGYSQNEFYIGGQSYAGKYVPDLGQFIHDRQEHGQTPEVHINFKGIFVGGGLCDPEHMWPVAVDSFYYMGLLSDTKRKYYKDTFADLLEKWLTNFPSPIEECFKIFDLWESTQLEPCMDSLNGCEATNQPQYWPFHAYLQTTATRHAFHVGTLDSDDPMMTMAKEMYKVQNSLMPGDFFRNTSGENAFLMENYKVMHFTGNLDLKITTAMTDAFLQHVPWSGRDEYINKDREPWRVDGELAGWVTTVGNFTMVVVRNAGHMVPYDQPKTTLEMMRRFIFDQDFVVTTEGGVANATSLLPTEI